MRLRSLCPWLLVVPLCACEWPTESSQVFNVSATLVSTTCGTGAVDAEDSISFQVSLARDDDELTWYDIDSGIQMDGIIVGEDVTVSGSQDFEVSEECSVRRRDTYDVTLTGTGNSIEQVDGDITYTFSQVSGTDCDSLIGDSDGFDDLPCKIKYEFVAVPDD